MDNDTKDTTASGGDKGKIAGVCGSNCSAYIIGASIIISALLISGAIIYGFKMAIRLSESGNPTALSAQNQTAPVVPTAALPAQQQPAAAGTPVNIVLKPNTPYLGSNNAKVTVVEFADYECPFCEQLYKNTWPELKAKYVATGQIKFVYQDFAFLGPDSNTAAEASHCAEDQNMFWQYHDYLFDNQGAEGSGWATAEHQKQFAAAVGLNTSLFDQCLDSGKYKQEVLNETAAGRNYGVAGTPAVLVLKSNNLSVDPTYITSQLQILESQNKPPIVNLPNGNTFISGSLPATDFEQAIDAALASK